MIADVRQHVSMRLRALLNDIARELHVDEKARAQIREARTDFVTAQLVRAAYRSRVVRDFPGCRIAFTQQHVTVWLPDRYPQSQIPIVEQISVIHTECFMPKGLSNQPF